jgi:hypothetical protein
VRNPTYWWGRGGSVFMFGGSVREPLASSSEGFDAVSVFCLFSSEGCW